MRNTLRVLMILLGASLLAATGTFVSVLAESGYYSAPGGLATWQTLGMALAVLLPPGLAAWRILRKLQPRYTRREARTASITFALITPMMLWVVLAVSEFPGGPTDRPGAILTMELIGATALIAALPNYVSCFFVMWLARQG